MPYAFLPKFPFSEIFENFYFCSIFYFSLFGTKHQLSIYSKISLSNSILFFKHDLLELWRVNSVDNTLEHVERHPRYERNEQHFDHKHPRYVACVKILGQKRYGQEVNEECQHTWPNDSPIQMVHRRIDIQEFAHDERAERDCHDIREWLIEEHEGSEHDHTSLEDRLEKPNQEGFARQRSSFLECGIQRRVLHTRFYIDVVVKHETEHGQRRVESCVAKNQHAIVDRNGDKVEYAAENGLDHWNYETAMNHKLAEHSWALIRQAPMPED